MLCVESILAPVTMGAPEEVAGVVVVQEFGHMVVMRIIYPQNKDMTVGEITINMGQILLRQEEVAVQVV